jgi:hypothetical protein
MRWKTRLLTWLMPALLAACASGDRTGPSDPQASRDTSTLDCATLDADACRASEACQTVRGSRVIASGEGAHCLESRQVIGCLPEQICGEALTYFCDPEGQVYEVTNTCGPNGWSECPAPDDLSGPCP